MTQHNKKIVDERQERQSQQNGNITYIVMLLMLCVLIIIQSWFMNRGLSYIWPELITLLTACILKIVLDIRQGNVYTETNAKTKVTIALYVGAAFIFALVLAIRNYILYGFALWKVTLIIIPVFFEMLILFAIAHYTYMKLSKRRLGRLESELEDGENDDSEEPRK